MVVWWSFTFTLKRLKWHLHNCQSCEQRSRHLPFGPLFPTNLPRKHFTPHRAHSGTLYASHKPGPKAHTRQTELTMRFEIICMGAPQALGPIVKALAARPVTDSVSTMWLRTRRGTCSSSNLIFPWPLLRWIKHTPGNVQCSLRKQSPYDFDVLLEPSHKLALIRLPLNWWHSVRSRYAAIGLALTCYNYTTCGIGTSKLRWE